MQARSVVVLDIPAEETVAQRRLLETLQATGMGIEEVNSIDGFASALRTSRSNR